jgi:hypothetical protein
MNIAHKDETIVRIMTDFVTGALTNPGGLEKKVFADFLKST